jgi:hypothetical protein
MPVKFLGRVLFPRLPDWQARRQARQMLAAIAVALTFGAIIAALILYQGFKR